MIEIADLEGEHQFEVLSPMATRSSAARISTSA